MVKCCGDGDWVFGMYCELIGICIFFFIKSIKKQFQILLQFHCQDDYRALELKFFNLMRDLISAFKIVPTI